MKDIFANVRRVVLLVVLLGLAAQAGATSYYFYRDNGGNRYYLAINASGSVESTTTFSQYCIWTSVSISTSGGTTTFTERDLGTSASNTGAMFAIDGSGNKRFLYYGYGSGSKNFRTTTSTGSNATTIYLRDGYLCSLNTLGYWVSWESNSWVGRNLSGNRKEPTINKITNTKAEDKVYSITTPTITPSSLTITALNSAQTLTASATATVTKTPAYDYITMNGTTYYIRKDTYARSTSVPTAGAATGIDVSYTWNKNTLPANASISTTSGATTNVTYNTAYTDADQSGSITLRATAVDGSTTTSTYKDASVNVTLKKIPIFYYTASAGVNIAEAGTATVSPSGNNQITGTSASQTSATASLKYTATLASGKDNLYQFAGWSTSPTGSIISTANPYTYPASVTSTNSSSRTDIQLYAIFNKLSRLKVKTASGMGYVYSCGDTPYSGSDPFSGKYTEDITTRNDGNSHTMYMYAKSLQQTVGGVTTDQFKFKGWSSTNSLSNIDGGTTAIGQTITVGSPEYKEMYAMFKRYFKFNVEGVSVSNGTVSTEGGTVVAGFSSAATGTTATTETEIETGTTSTVTTYFKATPLNGYQFKGWYYDEALTNPVGTSANPYTPTLENQATGTTATLKLYAKFTLETPPTSISIGSDFELAKGNNKNLTLTYTPNTAATHKYTNIVSSNTSIATVSPAHLEENNYALTVNGLAVGQTVITATAYGVDNTTPVCSTSVTVTVTGKVPTPILTVTPDEDNLNRALVTLAPGSGSPANAKIYYTTNGQDPTAASTEYTAPFYIDNGQTIKAIAICTDPGWSNSAIISQTYSKQKAKKPIINIDGNDVTFTSANEEPVTYYYTIDGSDPTTASTAWTSSMGPITNIPTGVTIKVIATKTGLGPSDVVSADYSRVKLPTPEIQIVGDRVWFIDAEQGVTYHYTTDGSTPTTSSASNDGSEIEITGEKTIKVIAVKSGYLNSDPAEKKKNASNVVYLDFASGNDSNDGRTATTAKKTWAGAYALLGFGPNAKYLKANWAKNGLTTLSNHTCFNGTTDASFTNTVDNNIIYLVGDVSESNFTALMNKTGTASSETNVMTGVLDAGFFKPATISGKYATKGTASDGRPVVGLSASDNHILNEDTRFEYIEFQGTSGSTSETQFVLAYYDLEMGKCITNKRFFATKDFDQSYHHGFAKGVTNTAHILFYGGHVNDSRFRDGTKEMQFDDYLPHPEGYKITIRSGFFSTISPGGKQWNSNINGVMGSPNTPVKCTILVDIDRAWNDAHQSGVLQGTSASDPITCDVAVLIAGTHEGSMYGDADIIVKSGKIDRVVNGSFGAHNQITGYPCDSYFGRANILIDPREPSADEKTAGYSDKNKLVEIRELYGGGLGRYKGSSSSNEAATNFYGKSTVIINGGTFSSAIYASGAGGCNGIGDDTHHTVDQYLPYGGNTSAPTYGNYAAWKAGTKTVVKCLDTDGVRRDIDLAKTSTKIEIHGGVFGSSSKPIEGIYGGGYGYVDKELIADGVTPHTQAGSILAAAGDLASSVLIDGKTEIFGNVYAAGRGTKYYYDYGRTTYTALALISGNTQLTIGGRVKVHGGVYGAGQGISTLANMARHYGNTSVTIKDYAQIDSAVYGGGRDGSIDGNTSLSIIDDATIGKTTSAANVHGGGFGSTTTVGGNVAVAIGAESNDEPIIYGDVYGGSAMGKVNTNTSNKTTVTLRKGIINGSLYGGGLGDGSNAADVNGNVQVDVYAGTVKARSANIIGSGSVFGCNNQNGTPKGSVAVDIYGTDQPVNPSEYALYAVYGGGNQSAYTGTPKVTVHYCDNSIEYVYGGGNASSVAGTDVTIWGGDVIGNVFGGGNGSSEGWPSGQTNPGANVTTSGTKVKINGGTILAVYGGSNTLGTITGGTQVVVNAQQDTSDSLAAYACPVIITNVFGAGNQAPYTGNTDVQIVNTGATGSIENVFGGGNLADMTGNTGVKIGAKNPDGVTYNVNITGNVFGGGNQADVIGNTNLSVENCNTVISGDIYGGANLADVTNSYVNVYGGTIENVFGGGRGSTTQSSDLNNATTYIYGGEFGGIFGAGNIKSNITGTAFLRVDEQTASEHACCPFAGADEIYGAGNQAPIDGSIDFGIGCIKGKIEELYGGAKDANLGSNINLTIISGAFGKVFGGNNLGGTINGSITVNITESGCDSIVIDTLYCGGNMAAYDATGLSAQPTLNINSCTRISRIYGGGYGASATMTGNPVVNIELVEGAYAADHKTRTGHKIGIIGSVYGGGSKAQVIGNTKVNIATQTGKDAIITGNVYGGGNMANVTGSTSVQVGPTKTPPSPAAPEVTAPAKQQQRTAAQQKTATTTTKAATTTKKASTTNRATTTRKATTTKKATTQQRRR